MSKNLQIGEMLVDQRLISRDQLEVALAEQAKTKEPLGRILVRLRFIESDQQLKLILSKQLNLPYVPLDQLKPKTDQRLKELVPKDMALEHLILPLERTGNRLKLAISKPPDIILTDNLRKLTNCDVQTVITTEEEMREAIERFYGSTNLEEVVSSSALYEVSELYAEGSGIEKVNLEQATGVGMDTAPVIRLVDILLKKALDDRASDIHIEPFADAITIRYRIDGVLYELPPPPPKFHAAVVSRVKILARIDIAEKRVPQDGSFAINYQGRKIDVRVSTIPVMHGEKVVMRLLDKRTELLDLGQLGFDDDQLKLFEECTKRPFGLIFLTGPTGSGKSTTLYAVISKRKSAAVNILTIEDPVEYQISGINQVQVKPEIGLTFATGLRAFLRQDPDVILVGEVRDQETAEICIRASLTGHLVLSTLHTNDAVTAITRLIDIGIRPYLVAGSLILIGAQRLARRLCPRCKEPKKLDAKMKADYRLMVDTIYQPKGCKECRGIGYWGRIAIFEFLPVDEKLRSAIARNEDIDVFRKIQREGNYRTLRESGMRKVEAGLTSIEEVLSISYE